MRVVWSQFTAPHQHKYDTNELGVDIQRFMRPTQFEYVGGLIASKLDTVQPGEWVKVVDNVDGSYIVKRHDGNGGLKILDWNPSNFYDPQTRQLITPGARRKAKMVAFSDITGRWREITQPDTAYIGTAHWYGNTAFDGSSAMLNKWLYDPVTSKWVDFRADTGFDFSRLGSLVWWPEYGEQGGWFNANNGSFVVYDIAEAKTVDLGAPEISDHATAARQPLTGQILVVGGSDTPLKATLIETDGSFYQVADMPEKFKMSQYPFFAHPEQNAFIRLTGDKNDNRFMAYWPEQDLWRDEGPYYGAGGGTNKHDTIAYIESHKVFISHRVDGVYAFKLLQMGSN